ncbi:MAG: transcriptional repressor LexA [Selenomonadaceae bacterium]|nr:transcriptional repressor LexA [Selenomonadaceae bacterium]
MRKTKTSSERQKEIFQYIKAFLLEKGYPPSVREIGKAVGLKSSSTVHGYLARLEANGLIKRDPTKPRAIDILDERPWGKSIPVPLINAEATDKALLSEQNVQEVFSFPQNLLGTQDKPFMMRMADNSMKDAGINQGDFVIVKKQEFADDGDIVAAIVNKQATVRRFVQDSAGIHLEAAGEGAAEAKGKRINILGRVIGLYRRF